MSRKRVPLNQNECTADFRIGVPFGQNLHLEETKKYFKYVKVKNDENGRNRVMHGFVHPRFWSKENFEQLIHHIAVLSPYSKF